MSQAELVLEARVPETVQKNSVNLTVVSGAGNSGMTIRFQLSEEQEARLRAVARGRDVDVIELTEAFVHAAVVSTIETFETLSEKESAETSWWNRLTVEEQQVARAFLEDCRYSTR